MEQSSPARLARCVCWSGGHPSLSETPALLPQILAPEPGKTRAAAPPSHQTPIHRVTLTTYVITLITYSLSHITLITYAISHTHVHVLVPHTISHSPLHFTKNSIDFFVYYCSHTMKREMIMKDIHVYMYLYTWYILT